MDLERFFDEEVADLTQATARLTSAAASPMSVARAISDRWFSADGPGVDDMRETTTHFVWCLRSNWKHPVGLYLHEYKDPQEMRSGYADSVHDHRYDFASLILRGGYTENRYKIKESSPGGAVTASVESLEQYGTGDINRVSAEVFHRIYDILPGSISFVIKLHAKKEVSTSIDLRTGEVRHHLPVESRTRSVARSLEELARGSGVS